MTSAHKVWLVARIELASALRNRRALVVTLLFLATAALVMYGTVLAFAAMERELLAAMHLPASDNPGAVTTALWKSPIFTRTIAHLSGDNLVLADIVGRHPVVLAYAFFIFQVVPLLTLMVSASSIADELHSGAARYWLVRVTRSEWSLGKFLGEALMLALAMLVGALAAWAVMLWRLPGFSAAGLLPGIVDWSLRAWAYAFAWLGLFMGISHVARSGGKARAFGILAMMAAAAWTPMLRNFSEQLPWLVNFEIFVPQSAMPLMWRRAPGALCLGAVQLAALATFYLAIGASRFRRRDV